MPPPASLSTSSCRQPPDRLTNAPSDRSPAMKLSSHPLLLLKMAGAAAALSGYATTTVRLIIMIPTVQRRALRALHVRRVLPVLTWLLVLLFAVNSGTTTGRRAPAAAGLRADPSRGRSARVVSILPPAHRPCLATGPGVAPDAAR